MTKKATTKQTLKGKPPDDADPDQTESRIRGFIPYPCCPQQKELVRDDAHGHVTHRCAQCMKYVEFDLDAMNAKVVKPCRGGTKRQSAVI